ncbi:aminotransferase, class IV [Gottschalkia purinilytica]|uniref:Aminotransferase, class IV n=1 Tax=Gottschalkia purinilytica TaxID=1503 RepID=A0A0L0WCJ7_GOTPU|nr:aminotransferase class IV [Gottschalkia purinilytica]KNF09204.1 aminotransferase, class IV [Gottschalkia purinilytica]
MYISINGKIVEDKNSSISPMSEGYMFGYGLFETIKVVNSKMCFLEEHIERLKKSCKKIGLEFNFNIKEIENRAYKILEKNKLNIGAIKIVYSKNGEENYLIITTRKSSYTENNYKVGYKICFSDIRRNPDSILPYIKSVNYMENIIAKKIGNEKGYEEVIFLNTKNKIAEGSVSNIFFIKNDILFTPSIECGILPGITRDKVIDIAKELDVKVNIGEFSKDELLNADEVFITNSLMDIMPISNIDNKLFNIEKNIITCKIMNKYKSLIGG